MRRLTPLPPFGWALVVAVALAASPAMAQGGPPCSGSHPVCDGECNPGEYCITGETGSECVCVADADVCGDSIAPECDGQCGPEQSCEVVGAVCACVSDPDEPCESSTPADECGGTCPPGLACLIDGSGPTSFCSCQPEIVECGVGDPTCNGECPEGNICQPGVGGGCECVPGPPCGSSPIGECDGSCTQDGFRCLFNGTDCSCEPVDIACSAAAGPVCDGACPDDMICAEAAVGDCSCQMLDCASSPFPECGGDCPAGFTCRSGPVPGSCVCFDDNLPCSAAEAPQCGGVCAGGSVCQLDSTGAACECAPIGADCVNALLPVCEGECPEGSFCDDVGGATCQCVIPPVCGDALAPECDGSCDQGEVCVEGILGDCVCEPVLTDCNEAPAPVCGGSCPDGHRCEYETASAICRCSDCALDGLEPSSDADVLWTTKETLRWSALDCAETYNVYRKVGALVDSDGDGAAEDYGSCFLPPLLTTEATDSSTPDPGDRFHYLVTGVSGAGVEGTLGNATSGAGRPNAQPCP